MLLHKAADSCAGTWRVIHIRHLIYKRVVFHICFRGIYWIEDSLRNVSSLSRLVLEGLRGKQLWKNKHLNVEPSIKIYSHFKMYSCSDLFALYLVLQHKWLIDWLHNKVCEDFWAPLLLLLKAGFYPNFNSTKKMKTKFAKFLSKFAPTRFIKCLQAYRVAILYISLIICTQSVIVYEGHYLVFSVL